MGVLTFNGSSLRETPLTPLSHVLFCTGVTDTVQTWPARGCWQCYGSRYEWAATNTGDWVSCAYLSVGC